MIISIEHEGKIIVKNKDGDVPTGLVSFNTISKVAEIDSHLTFVKEGAEISEDNIGTAKHNVITVLREFDAYHVKTGELIIDLDHYKSLEQ